MEEEFLDYCTVINSILILGDSALEPLVITDDKVISVNRDHLLTPQALANLFCNQLHRLKTAYIEPITGEFLYFSSNHSLPTFRVEK